MEREESHIIREEPGAIEPGVPVAGPGPGGRVVEESRYVSEPGASAAETQVVRSFSPARRAVEMIYVIFGVLSVLLAFRVILKVLGANSQVAFTSFVYGISDVLLAPFRNILPVYASGKSVFELSALLAIVVYLLIGYLIARVVAIMFLRDVTVSSSSRTRGYRPRPD